MAELRQLKPLEPLTTNKAHFFTIRNNDIIIPLPDGPFTREELAKELNEYIRIVGKINKHSRRLDHKEDFCRSTNAIDEYYLLGQIQGTTNVIYYYDPDDYEKGHPKHPDDCIHYEDETEEMVSCLGGAMTIKVNPDPQYGVSLRATAACVPIKNRGVGGDFILIFKEIAKMNNIRKITLECFNDDLLQLYKRKGFKEVSYKNNYNSNGEGGRMYEMELIIPKSRTPKAPRPKSGQLFESRVPSRRRSANYKRNQTRNQNRVANARRGNAGRANSLFNRTRKVKRRKSF